MRIKWIALTFFLGFIVIIDPTQMPAQDKGKGKGGDRGMFGKGGGGIPGMGGGAFPGGYGATPGIAIVPGAFPMPNYGGGGFAGNPGGFGGPPGGFGGGGPGGFGRGGMGGPGGGMGGPGGGMGGPGGGGGGAMNAFFQALRSPETAWVAIQQQSGGGDADSIDLAKISPTTRNWLKAVIDKTNAAQLPESGLLTRADFFAMYTQNAAINDASRAQRMMPGMGPDGFGPRNGMDGWDNGGNPDKQSRNQKKDKDPDEDKPVAIRYGHLPKGLPDWFEEYDIDKDGQVALWEWRKAGESIKTFKEYDLNDDGVITADEVIRGEQIKTEAARNLAYENGDKPPPVAKNGKGGQKPAVAADGETPAKGPNADRNNGGPPGKGPRDPNATPGERPSGKGPRDSGAGKDNSSDSEKKPPEKGKNRTPNKDE